MQERGQAEGNHWAFSPPFLSLFCCFFYGHQSAHSHIRTFAHLHICPFAQRHIRAASHFLPSQPSLGIEFGSLLAELEVEGAVASSIGSNGAKHLTRFDLLTIAHRD